MSSSMDAGAFLTVPQARAMEDARPDVRVELVDGAIYAMGRASIWHAVMTSAIARSLGNMLPEGCRTAAESCAVGVALHDPTYVHPDVTVLCGPSQVHPEEPTVVMNPSAVFEVLSPSTAIRDWNDKLPKYKSMASLKAIAYFDHTARTVTAYLRTERGWEEVVESEGRLELSPLGVALDVAALYDAARSDGGP